MIARIAPVNSDQLMGSAKSLDAVCRIPSVFYRGGLSFVQIVRDSGVSKDDLSKETLVQVLGSDPCLVNDWLRWSMDKRVSSGWFFKQEENGYLVGFYPDGQHLFFEDAATACSEFIVNEVGPYAL